MLNVSFYHNFISTSPDIWPDTFCFHFRVNKTFDVIGKGPINDDVNGESICEPDGVYFWIFLIISSVF